MLYELCMLKHAFESSSLLGLVYKIVSDHYEPIPSMYSEELMEIIKKMLTKSAEERPDTAESTAAAGAGGVDVSTLGELADSMAASKRGKAPTSSALVAASQVSAAEIQAEAEAASAVVQVLARLKRFGVDKACRPPALDALTCARSPA